jgi:membrane associated rhomboid family serine protease
MIPLRTDRRLKHTPWVNITLIVVNVLVFLATRHQIDELQHFGAAEGSVFDYYLFPLDPQWKQYITYQFLHGGWQHLIFNMLFLYVFGNCLEDRLGSLGYLFFYLAGGVVAGIGHSLTSTSPVIGASGSVSAVTGGFLALFPLSRVTILWPFIIIFITEWPSMYFILLAFAKDVIFQFADVGNVAYLAHISGNIYGFAIGMGLLAVRILPREPYDFLALLDRWNRRRQLRTMARQGASPWQADAPVAMAQHTLTDAQERILRLRASVQQALRERRHPEALAAYEQLVEADPRQVLPRQFQLDLAAWAMRAGQFTTAAQAYEGFLRAYPRDLEAHEINLVLGLLYSRYLDDARRARPLLEHAQAHHTDPARRALAEDLLAEIG